MAAAPRRIGDLSAADRNPPTRPDEPVGSRFHEGHMLNNALRAVVIVLCASLAGSLALVSVSAPASACCSGKH